MILGTCLPDAAFVCESESGRILACNQKFLELAAIDAASPDIALWRDQLIHFDSGDDLSSSRRADGAWVEAHVQALSSPPVPVRVSETPLSWHQASYQLCFARDIRPEKMRDADWKRQVEEQKGRALTAIASSLRVYHLSEKIKWTPILTRDLLCLDNEQDLLRHAAELLTDDAGLNYQDVSFILARDDRLEVAFTTRDLASADLLSGREKVYRRFLEGESEIGETDEGILVRLELHGNLVGCCEVLPYEREKAFFDGLARMSELQSEFLAALGDILSLLLANMRLQGEIRRQSVIDPLTETFNRRHFMERLRSEMERAARYDREISLVFVDLDGFKYVNDEFGHLHGDYVLKEIASILMEIFREVDSVCRYGGDEFVILLPETGQEMARQAASKLVDAVASHSFIDLNDSSKSLPITVSVGVSTRSSPVSQDEFLHAADLALLKAKRQGKNQVASHP